MGRQRKYSLGWGNGWFVSMDLNMASKVGKIVREKHDYLMQTYCSDYDINFGEGLGLTSSPSLPAIENSAVHCTPCEYSKNV